MVRKGEREGGGGENGEKGERGEMGDGEKGVWKREREKEKKGDSHSY